ncbi:MAG TPA: hypothetical protein VN841_11735 [Bryobacteraceae bacterium]|nr:hypothetical protein [Bryobacteraceae bacterium]
MLWLIAALPCQAAVFSFHVVGNDAGSWPAIFGSMGLAGGTAADAGVIVVPSSAKAAPGDWAARVAQGALLVIEGDSPTAQSFGFRPNSARVAVRALSDVHAPKLDIVWERQLDLPRFEVPVDARVFARERHSGAPLLAGVRRGSGAVLWLAAPPGDRGYERFPYLPQAMLDLGLELPFRSARLWAFFDSSYRARVDLDYFAAHWRESGIAALHVAAWHYWERDPQADAYLDELIQACHRHSILVYAWFEFPHVSERFWTEHPEWREKTALLQDAQLDWRKLTNLTNRDAFAAVAAGLRDAVGRFDWDGVNLAEMYFESLEGHENAARFTPMNNDVRALFRAQAGFDPLELFDARSPHYFRTTAAGMARFLEFRTELARRQEQEWIAYVDQLRKFKPHLDLVLTHVDDRFDPAMREKIGADAARTLPLMKSTDFTFLVEDPANLWNLGPERYPTIAARYRAIASRPEKLAIDINVVERYQDVYPTKQETGVELMQVIHTAAAQFPRVALYFESSIAAPDWPLLAPAAADVGGAERTPHGWKVNSRGGVSMAWQGPALVDGRPWPASTGSSVQLPGGTHTIEPAPSQPPLRILDFNGEMKSATATASGVEIIYESSSRAFVRLDARPSRVTIDGVEMLGVGVRPESGDGLVMLPRGQHLAAMWR